MSDRSIWLAEGKEAALEVLRNNAVGPFMGLPRTAAWGYPEPYARDMMISALGFIVSRDAQLFSALRDVLAALAKNQSPLGQIPSLANDPQDLGSSDATPLFLVILSIFQKVTADPDYLSDAAYKAMTWMAYQSPDETMLIAQQPTSDWRDEQWVLGYSLYVNSLAYLYLRLFHQAKRAEALRDLVQHFDVRSKKMNRLIHEGLSIPGKPYYALWSYKMYNNERFDLLGNSLAILSGIASPTRGREIVAWVEDASEQMRQAGDLAVDLPPCLFPFIQKGDWDWYPRLQEFNPPGAYHNGGIWPFVCGFYIAALVSLEETELAWRKLESLTDLVRQGRQTGLVYGFNEWYRAQDGTPQGQDWQTWSAAMYLYAAAVVEQGTPLFFEDLHSPLDNY